MKKDFSLIIVTILIVTVIVIVFIFLNSSKIPTTPILTPSPIATSSATPKQVLGVRTKVSGCVASNGLPDKDCTPGAIFAEVTKDQVCVPGYSKSVRNVTEAEKEQVFAEYGIASHQPGEYEIDHFISLELGGSNEISNLWPEAYSPTPGAHEKDKVENYLHEQVCNGNITLEKAQQQISNNWLEIYFKINP